MPTEENLNKTVDEGVEDLQSDIVEDESGTVADDGDADSGNIEEHYDVEEDDEPEEDLTDEDFFDEDGNPVKKAEDDAGKEEVDSKKADQEKAAADAAAATAAEEAAKKPAAQDFDALTLEDEIKTRIDPAFVPGTKEFFDAVAADAKAAVIKDLGEYDELDPACLTRFQYYSNEGIADRKREHAAAIEIVKEQRESRNNAKVVEEKRKAFVSEVEKILPTPELQKGFDALLESMSKNSRGDYLVLMEDLKNGKTEGFMALAKKVAGPHGQALRKEWPKPVPAKPVGKKNPSKERVGSDILGF